MARGERRHRNALYGLGPGPARDKIERLYAEIEAEKQRARRAGSLALVVAVITGPWIGYSYIDEQSEPLFLWLGIAVFFLAIVAGVRFQAAESRASGRIQELHKTIRVLRRGANRGPAVASHGRA